MPSDIIGEADIVIGADASGLGSSVERQASGPMSRAGKVVGDSFTTALKSTLAVAGAAIGVGLAKSIDGGMKRLVSIDTATAKLKGLGYQGKQLDSIMGQVSKSVDGTAFSLGDAANAASLLMTSGIKPGKELDASLKAITGTAAAAGVGIGEIAPIYQKVASQGKVSGEVIAQLADRGVNATSALAKSLGKTPAQIQKMVSKGKISYTDFTKAMTASTGDMAKSMGNSFEGIKANINSAFGRIGAAALEPLFNAAKTVMPQVLSLMKDLAKQITLVMEPVGPIVAKIAKGVSTTLGKIDIAGAFSGLGSAISSVSGLILPLLGALSGSLGGLVQHIPVVGEALGGIFGKLSGPIGLVIGFFIQMVKESKVLRGALGNAFTSFLSILRALQPVFEAVSSLMGTLAKTLGDVLGKALNAVMPILVQLAQTIAPMLATMLRSLTPVITTLGTVVSKVLLSAFDNLIPIVLSVVQTVLPPLMKIIRQLMPVIAQIAKVVGDILVTAFDALGPVITQLVDGVLPILMKLITGLVARILPLVQQVLPLLASLFKQLLPPIMQVISALLEALMPVLDALVPAILEIVSAALPPLVQILKALVPVIVLVVNIVAKLIIALMPLVTLILNLLVPALTLLATIVSKVFTAMGVIITKAITAIQVVLRTVMGAISVNWSKVWGSVRDTVLRIWRAIEAGLAAGWAWINAHVFAPLKAGLRAVQGVFSSVRTAILSIWSGMRAGLSAGWQWISAHVLAPFKHGLSLLRATFSAVRATIATIWHSLETGLYNGWAWISGHVFGPFKHGLSLVRAAFSNVKGTILGIWHGLETGLSSGWSWISLHVFTPFKHGLGLVRDAFSNAVKTIKSVWGGLKSALTKPIKGVIDLVYNNGIVKMVNALGKLVGKKPLSPISLKGWDTGGRTTPGPKTKVAGVVHADEFVLRKFARRRLEQTMPGALDFANRTGQWPTLPGYASGGLAGAVKWWKERGASISEYGKGIGSGHMKGSLHYRGLAADLNYGSGARERAFFDHYLPLFRKAYPSLGVIWQSAGHYDHMHIDTSGISQLFGKKTFVKGWNVKGIPGLGTGSFGSVTATATDDGGWSKVMGAVKNLGKLPGKLTGAAFGSPFGKLMVDVAKKLVTWPVDWLKDKASSLLGGLFGGGGGGGSAGSAGGAARWKSVAAKALKMAGAPASLLSLLLHRINVESGGNPKAINLWDSNWKAGHPSQGLMQTIPSTFAAYAGKLRGRGITDPLANIYAAIRYTLARYGLSGIQRAWGGRAGYDSGGMWPSGTMGYNATGKPEAVLDPAQTKAFVRFASMLTSPAARRVGAVAEQGGSAVGRQVHVEKGAIVVNTPVSDPHLVATQVLNRFVRVAV